MLDLNFLKALFTTHPLRDLIPRALILHSRSWNQFCISRIQPKPCILSQLHSQTAAQEDKPQWGEPILLRSARDEVLPLLLTSTPPLQSCTSHRQVLPALCGWGRCPHGWWWWFWWPHWHGLDRTPDPAHLECASEWAQSRWPGCRDPSCSHHCTVTSCKHTHQGGVVSSVPISSERCPTKAPPSTQSHDQHWAVHLPQTWPGQAEEEAKYNVVAIPERNSCKKRQRGTEIKADNEQFRKERDSLIEESKQISHDNDDSPGQSDDDLLDLVHPLGGILSFWNTWNRKYIFKPTQDGAQGTKGTYSWSGTQLYKENNSTNPHSIHWFTLQSQQRMSTMLFPQVNPYVWPRFSVNSR